LQELISVTRYPPPSDMSSSSKSGTLILATVVAAGIKPHVIVS